MNVYLSAAAALLVVIGLVHSVFGELLIFRRMRPRGVVPAEGGKLLRSAHVRILWASWHIVTVLGWCVAALLWWLAQPPNAHLARALPGAAAIAALAASSVLVLAGTRGRHPGWAGLLAAAVLAWIGIFS